MEREKSVLNEKRLEEIITSGGSLKEAAIEFDLPYYTVWRYWRKKHGRHNRLWTDADRQKINDLLSRGYSHSKIGKHFGVDRFSILQQIEIIKNGGPKTVGRPNLAKANAETIESIIAGGGTIKEAAIVIGVSYLTVSKYWRDTHGKTKKKWTNEERLELVKLRDSGLTYSEIGKRKGVSESSVRHQVEYVERLCIGT